MFPTGPFPHGVLDDSVQPRGSLGSPHPPLPILNFKRLLDVFLHHIEIAVYFSTLQSKSHFD